MSELGSYLDGLCDAGVTHGVCRFTHTFLMRLESVDVG